MEHFLTWQETQICPYPGLSFHDQQPGFNETRANCESDCSFAFVCRGRFGSQSYSGFPPAGANSETCALDLSRCLRSCGSF